VVGVQVKHLFSNPQDLVRLRRTKSAQVFSLRVGASAPKAKVVTHHDGNVGCLATGSTRRFCGQSKRIFRQILAARGEDWRPFRMQLTVNHDGRVRERVPVPWFSCRAVRDSPSARNILLSTKGSGSSPPAKMREAIDEACPTTIVCTGVCTNCICEKWISSLSSAEMSNAAIDVFSPSLPHRVIDRKTGSDAPPWRVDVERDGRRRFRLEEEHLRDDDRRERIVNLH
jgi:hypothetical protein